jgi:hypothetical protein
MTDDERALAIELILAETPDIRSYLSVVETALLLGFEISTIRSARLIAAIDDARSKLEAMQEIVQ